MSNEKIREALEAARAEISYYKDTYAGGLTDKEIGNCKAVIQQIDEALKTESDTPLISISDADLEAVVEKAEKAGYKKGWEERSEFDLTPGELKPRLLELPDKIKAQQQKITDISQAIEHQRLLIEKMKNDNMDVVLSATENGKPKFTNEQARKIALEKLLRDDEQYNKAFDVLTVEERQFKLCQIELDYLYNQFRAYLAVAGMQGVKV